MQVQSNNYRKSTSFMNKLLNKQTAMTNSNKNNIINKKHIKFPEIRTASTSSSNICERYEESSFLTNAPFRTNFSKVA
jgi:hypothetical protein